MTYPNKWPDGTLKTLHTPFNWRFEINVPADHLKTSQRASEPSECTTAFNQWRTLMENPMRKNVPPWPEYRDAFNAREEAKAARARRRAELIETVPQHLHLHTLSDKVGSVERAKAKRAKLVGKPNHARSQ